MILGRQIINILPEGSAVLNPNHIPLCLDLTKSAPSVQIPLQVNHTSPVSIELVRFDLALSTNESITIPVSQTKKMRKEAERAHDWQPSDPVLLQYTVKKTGLYRLLRVIDDTNFEVSKRSSEVLVVACPTAQVSSNGPNRCRGDLSDISLTVSGTPPLRVKYHRSRNDGDRDVSYQNIQPDDFVSPLMRGDSQLLVLAHSQDLSWAAAHKVKVSLNETLDFSGRWTYSIEKVTDALNNVVDYMVVEEGEKPRNKSPHSEGSFIVHESPKLAIQGATVQKPLQIAKGRSVTLPLRLSSTGKGPITDVDHTLRYLFSPTEALTATGEHGVNAQLREFVISKQGKRPDISEAGLYTLESISTPYCAGEIEEPASTMLVNPPEPDINVTAEAIADKCAGRPVGLKLDIDLVGTPPFSVQYSVKQEGVKGLISRTERFAGSRGQLELKPESAGQYTYTLTSLGDRIYDSRTLHRKDLIFEQSVSPSVSAHFTQEDPAKRQVRACIDESVAFDVLMQGEGPWSLEYELVHAGRRYKKRITDINDSLYTIETGSLSNGGDYTLALVSVVDKLGCKETLQQEAKISVRHQKPKVSFGNIEGKRTVRTLEGKRVKIPVRLTGEGSWTVQFKDAEGKFHLQKMDRANDFVDARYAGQYELISVRDVVCPGSVEESASTFTISQVARPKLSVAESPLMGKHENTLVRKDVCENDEDALDIMFEGRPPFSLKYEEHITLEQGQKSLMNKDMNVPQSTAQIKMDTVKAGQYEYRLSQLGDENYDPDQKHPQYLTIKQRVNPRPSASFATPGKVYSFCHHEGSSEEVIPIKLQGHPPFTVDVELRGIGKASRPIPITFSNILVETYDLRIPHSHLQSGNSALFIRRIRDSRGCERILDTTPSTPRVQISVHAAPTISDVEPQKRDYCVGERISFALSGQNPFAVYYNFEGRELKADKIREAVFRRIAERPGNFTITGISDAASTCRGSANITKIIHAMPSVKVSKGRESRVDIHAGGEAEITFEFGGVPPFEFTYQRSENAKKGDRRDHGAVLETKTLTSMTDKLSIKASEEGTYEVVAISDRYCSYAKTGHGQAKRGNLLKEHGEL